METREKIRIGAAFLENVWMESKAEFRALGFSGPAIDPAFSFFGEALQPWILLDFLYLVMKPRTVKLRYMNIGPEGPRIPS